MVEIETVEDEDSDDTPPAIQLGFSEPIRPDTADIVGHRSARWWNDWDGGQIGGRPSWLQPRDLPEKKALICTSCTSPKPLQFICQLYVPLDNNPDAFHRSFYIFGCPTCCRSQSHLDEGETKNDSENSSSKRAGTGIRVLRVQLSKENEFYPMEGTAANIVESWNKHVPETWNVHLCHVCGQRAAGKCPLQKIWFCGKEHQREYKRRFMKAIKAEAAAAAASPPTTQNTDDNKSKEAANVASIIASEEIHQEEDEEAPLMEDPSPTVDEPGNKLSDSSQFLPSVYAESELVVEEEPKTKRLNGDDDDDDDNDEIEARPTMFPALSSTIDNSGYDSDEDLEQEDLNEMVTGTKLDQTSTKDAATVKFYCRIQERKAPDQCLRYSMEWRRTYDSHFGDDSTTNNEDKNSNATRTVDDDTSRERFDDDSQPLWIRSDHQPAEIPPCPYCHAPRAFEFQLMPQMLNFLRDSRPMALASPAETTNTYQAAKHALIAAQSIIANTDPSQIPPSFADTKAKAMEVLQADLYKGDDYLVDWGIVAIYSCTKSCSGGMAAGKGQGPHGLGAYREEFAWLQPALDT